MYILIVALTMLVLPIVSIVGDMLVHPGGSLVGAVARWFVFWGVGVRLALAGVRQVVQPRFTATHIFHVTSDDVLPIVRELGIANLASAAIALVSIALPAFVLPAALYAMIFYAIAGVRHAMEPNRSRNETIAMVSDLFMAAVMVAVLGAAIAGKL